MKNVLELAEEAGEEYIKKSDSDGGQWDGPCPKCGGEDRFIIWPNHPKKKGGL